MATAPVRVDLGSTVSVLGARVMLAFARERRVDVGALLAELGVDAKVLDDPDGRISLALYRRAWELAAARSRDPIFGLHVAERSCLGAFETLDYALWSSANLEDALVRLARFHRLIGDDLAIHIATRGAWARIHREAVHDQPQREECFLALIALRARELVSPGLAFHEVRFAHRRPADVRPHAALFRCPVRFGSDTSEITLEAALLHHAVRSAKPGLAAVLDRYMRDLLARLPARDSFLERVHHAIARSLHGGRPSLAATARLLHVSPRTLQRRLQQLGVSHREIVEEVRREMAERLLARPRLSISEVAYLLGFEDASGFRRTYKRWTGAAPSRRRARA